MTIQTGKHAIESMQLEERRYPPPPEFAKNANAKADIYNKPLEDFWREEAQKRVTWFKPFDQVLEWKLPYAKWFLGGKLNVCYNCVDRHVEAGRGDKVAYYWEGEPVDQKRTITFSDLQRDVVQFANALKKLGVKKGTPVGIYMGMVPELPVAMLACTRLGAPHTVVFGGFSADSLSGRLNDMECELLITQNEGLRNGTTGGIYEGVPNFPDKDRWWDIIERYKVDVLYTAPTAIRTHMKWGPEYAKKHDLSSLRLLGTVGEPINPEAWVWYRENVGRGKTPVVDTWWQTETGMILINPLPGVTTLKPGSATKPFPTVDE